MTGATANRSTVTALSGATIARPSPRRGFARVRLRTDEPHRRAPAIEHGDGDRQRVVHRGLRGLAHREGRLRRRRFHRDARRQHERLLGARQRQRQRIPQLGVDRRLPRCAEQRPAARPERWQSRPAAARGRAARGAAHSAAHGPAARRWASDPPHGTAASPPRSCGVRRVQPRPRLLRRARPQRAPTWYRRRRTASARPPRCRPAPPARPRATCASMITPFRCSTPKPCDLCCERLSAAIS